MACPGRTATNTGRIGTLVAPFGTDLHFKLRVGPVVHLHDPVAAIPDGNLIFCLAGNNTIAAADTFFGINGHCESHAFTSLSGFSVKNVTKFPLIPVPPITGSIITLVISAASLTPFP
jgi:hypothetical protein